MSLPNPMNATTRRGLKQIHAELDAVKKRRAAMTALVMMGEVKVPRLQPAPRRRHGRNRLQPV